MKDLFYKPEVKKTHTLSKQDKKRLNGILENAFDLKKDYLVTHLANKIELYKLDGLWVYFSVDQRLYPTLSNFNSCKFKTVFLDKGASAPLSRGADVMAPGILKYIDMCPRFSKDETVGIEIIDEGLIAIGRTIKSYDEMLSHKEGVVIETLHVKGDGLDLHSF